MSFLPLERHNWQVRVMVRVLVVLVETELDRRGRPEASESGGGQSEGVGVGARGREPGMATGPPLLSFPATSTRATLRPLPTSAPAASVPTVSLIISSHSSHSIQNQRQRPALLSQIRLPFPIITPHSSLPLPHSGLRAMLS